MCNLFGRVNSGSVDRGYASLWVTLNLTHILETYALFFFNTIVQLHLISSSTIGNVVIHFPVINFQFTFKLILE